MKLFLDDKRSIPSDYIGARGYEECIRLLTQNRKNITEISLDYHLDEIRNGYSVCIWIVENSYYENLELIRVHSNDQRAISKMLEFLDKNIPKNIKLQYFDNKREIIDYTRT